MSDKVEKRVTKDLFYDSRLTIELGKKCNQTLNFNCRYLADN